MILGCDVGTASSKAVLMEGRSIRYFTSTPTQANPDQAMRRILQDLRQQQQLGPEDLEEIRITGWGQDKVSLAHVGQPLMNCLGRAAVWAVPTCRSVLCLGCQQSVVLSVNPGGRVLEFRANDKCAAGAGRFLEVISAALEIDAVRSSEVAGGADKELNMSSQCAVFAESEVVSLVNAGESVANIMSALLHALSRSVATLAKRITPRPDCVVAGGLAGNETLVDYLQKRLKMRLKVFPPRPDLIAAVGAALPAQGAQG
ncbi:MAG: acyl-CoA dehydratase activase [bacterium]